VSEVRISARGQGRIYWGLVSGTNFIVGGKHKGNKLKAPGPWKGERRGNIRKTLTGASPQTQNAHPIYNQNLRFFPIPLLF